jgi:hypothetical protein
MNAMNPQQTKPQLQEQTEVQVFGEIVLKDEERTPCEIWTRVMGYHRPVSAFNPGKQSEYLERTPFRDTLSCCASEA